MTLDKERLLNLAYELLKEPGWPREVGKPGNTAMSTVARIFREFARLPASADRMHQALFLIEKLPQSTLARSSMPDQYRGILGVLRVRNGRVNHPALKNLSFEELAYVIGWVNRLHRAVGIPPVPPAGEATVERGQRKNLPGGRKGRPGAGFSGKLQRTADKATTPEKADHGNADDIDLRWAPLKNWSGFGKTK